MVVREWWEVKWIQWIAVQENWSTVVSVADTVNIVWGWTVTDVWGVATINIPYWAERYREDVPAGSATYTFVNEPATATSFLIFTDSGTLLFSGIDYTYNPSTQTVTFLSLDTNEAAYIWVAHASVVWGNIWDMVKAVYDPNNVQRNVYDYNNFINTPTIPAAQIQSDWDEADNTKLDFIKNKPSIPAAQIQSDWNQADNTKLDYIKNKPTIPSVANLVTWAASSTDWNIAVFDWATWKVIKDSWFNIQVVNSQPSWSKVDVYYDNWTIYLFPNPEYVILTEDWNTLATENNDPLILEN